MAAPLVRIAQKGKRCRELQIRLQLAQLGVGQLRQVGHDDPAELERALGTAFARVHPFPSRAFYFGGVHAVAINENGETHAAGDPRRGGACRIVE